MPDTTSVDFLIGALSKCLYSDVDARKHLPHKRPLLAHYTSVENLRNILTGEELWFSNPLSMNDHEELYYGLQHGMQAVRAHKDLFRTCEALGCHNAFISQLDACKHRFDSEHAFDTYVACFSEHDPAKDADGRLSMWRGYGGNGSGAAIVFDTEQLTLNEQSPLMIAPVEYLSREARLAWINQRLDRFTTTLQRLPVNTNNVGMVAAVLFQRLLQASLFSKHHGFSEEQEWRVVYFPNMDHANTLKSMFSYWIGPSGVQPKLKFRFAPLQGITAPDFGLDKLVHSIILGPTHNPLSQRATLRMLQLERPALVPCLRASTTPFRAT
ncbi:MULTISPECIES: DUF2971 domain-containing protein [unclassified Burkholderia]|uniref:DUF2971 domain-containing protein n=1 Tax=unclassified Burkholderia TaxID=2613784 RepID=UPI002AB203F6|nr:MULTISPECIES: DUF2971 domain-containing protein [unclassified Burkholderia]